PSAAEEGGCAGGGADGGQEPIGEPGGLAHEVEMAVGDGIERSRKKRGPRHGGGLARALGSRKVDSGGLRAAGGSAPVLLGVARAQVERSTNCCCLRLLLNQNYEPLPSRGRSVACPILAPGSSPTGSHD